MDKCRNFLVFQWDNSKQYQFINTQFIVFLSFLSLSPLSHTSVSCDHLQNKFPVSNPCFQVSLK